MATASRTRRRGSSGSQAAALPPGFADWFAARGWAPHCHQLDMLAAAQRGESALLIAPTGGGKTLAGFLPSLIELAGQEDEPTQGLHTLYISPLKALAVDIHRNLEEPIAEMDLPFVEAATPAPPATAPADDDAGEPGPAAVLRGCPGDFR
jgi:ATP-dependent Lhr-like helicase